MYRQNVKDKLRSIGVVQSVWKEFLSDIFGAQVGYNYQKGLIDTDSSVSFTAALQNCKEKWNNLECSCFLQDHCPQFFDWFLRYKADDMINCMLSNVRAKAGITEVGGKYTTNNSEAVNHIIKIEVEWKESKLPVLIHHLQSIANEHQELVQKAVISKEEWKFCREYQSLQVDEHTWFSKMTLESRQQHIQKVQSTKLIANNSSHSNDSVASRITISFNVLKDCDISHVTLAGIWHKASQLIENDHVICVTWSDCGKDRLVKSSSSDTPHLVTLKKGLYVCDSRCQMYAGFSICSHVVAASQHNGDLSSYLTNFAITYTSPNLSHSRFACRSWKKRWSNKKKAKQGKHSY